MLASVSSVPARAASTRSVAPKVPLPHSDDPVGDSPARAMATCWRCGAIASSAAGRVGGRQPHVGRFVRQSCGPAAVSGCTAADRFVSPSWFSSASSSCTTVSLTYLCTREKGTARCERAVRARLGVGVSAQSCSHDTSAALPLAADLLDVAHRDSVVRHSPARRRAKGTRPSVGANQDVRHRRFVPVDVVPHAEHVRHVNLKVREGALRCPHLHR